MHFLDKLPTIQILLWLLWHEKVISNCRLLIFAWIKINQLIALDCASKFIKDYMSIGTQVLKQYYLVNASFASLGMDRDEPRKLLATSSAMGIQLIKIQTPSFNGNTLHWRMFCEAFISLVKNNKQLSSIQNFPYLLSTVLGSAASIIRSIPLTETNYHIVFNTLHERFDNKCILLTSSYIV